MRRSLVLCVVIGAFATAVCAASAWSRSAGGAWLQVRDGTRVKTRDDDCVYLVDRGVLRPITYSAYVKLWKGWGGIVEVADVPSSLVGPRLEPGVRLVKTKDSVAVWLLDGTSTKRAVSDVAAFDAYGFWWSLVEIVPAEEIDRLSVGTPVE